MNVADSHVFHGSSWQNPYRVAAYGKGIYLYDTEGKCYLEAIVGTHVVSIGHGVEEVAEAIATQARKWNNLPHQFLMRYVPGNLTLDLQPSGITVIPLETSRSRCARI